MHRHAWCATVLVLSVACAHSQGARQGPGSALRLGAIRSVALLPPQVKAFEMGAGGHAEEKAEWSAISQKNAAKAVAAQLNAIGLDVRPAPPADDELNALSH